MHLLLIEDDLQLGAEVQRALGGYGFTSEWVRSARQAQALTLDDGDGEPPFACVLLDLGLPDGDGLRLLRGWRARGLKLPVIVLTARDALESRISGLDGGADDYLIKPVAPPELSSRIHAVVRRTGGHASSILDMDGLQVDLSRHEVRLDGGPVGLSPKEFVLLAELARRAGEIVPKHRLARALAPLGDAIDFTTLEWHVHRLRRKIGEARVRTVRGVGYILAE